MNYIDNIKEVLNEIRSVHEVYSESKIEYQGNNKIINESPCGKSNSLRLQNNFGRLMALFPLFFSCLDSFIDSENQNLVGRTFKEKHDNMRQNSEFDKVIKETYRILIIIRNISSHDINSCIFNNKININYNFGKTNFILDMNEKGLKLIYGLILTLINESQFNYFGIPKYKDGVYLYYNNLIKNEINSLKDDKKTVQFSHTTPIRYARDILLDAEFQIVGNHLKFDYSLSDECMINFCIKYIGNEYIIPQEILDNNYELDLIELKNWELQK